MSENQQSLFPEDQRVERPLLVTVPYACKLLSRSRARIYELVKMGELEAIVDRCGPRGRILIPREAIDQWLKIKRRQRA